MNDIIKSIEEAQLKSVLHHFLLAIQLKYMLK